MSGSYREKLRSDFTIVRRLFGIPLQREPIYARTELKVSVNGRPIQRAQVLSTAIVVEPNIVDGNYAGGGGTYNTEDLQGRIVIEVINSNRRGRFSRARLAPAQSSPKR